MTEEQKAYNRFLARYRIVGEHTLACMNRFHVLRQVYRHQHSEHSRVVRIVAGLVNRRIAERPLNVYAVAGVQRMTGWRAGEFDRKHVSSTIAPQV